MATGRAEADLNGEVTRAFVRSIGGESPRVMLHHHPAPTTLTSPGTSSGTTGDQDLADKAEEEIAERPWVMHVVRSGWIAKGVVYALMGFTAYTIGRHHFTSDEASPEGALGQIAESTGGKVLLLILGVGLFLYALWRLLSVVLVRGHSPRDWADRVGYLFSAGFYTILGVYALGGALRRETPEDKNTVERLSIDLLESSWGRWVLFVAGAVTLAVGIYFVVSKSLKRSFLEELQFEGASKAERRAVVWSGVIGWMGRGLVTAAVGWFVVTAAWKASGSDARGFDRSLRELADSSFGGVVVVAAGLALVVYGAFCIVGLRHMKPGRASGFLRW